MNVSKVILPIGSCHCLANKAERLIRLHLEKRDSDSDKWARKTDDTSSQVCSTQYRGGHYEHFQEQNETQKLVAHRELNDSMLSTAIPQPTERQHIGNQIKAAIILARSDFVNMHHFGLRGNRFTITAAATAANTRTPPTINAMMNGSASGIAATPR
jgi:hypothetical protein